MVSDSMSLGGVVTFWSLSEATDRNALEMALRAVGLADYCPERRTRAAALKDAIHALVGHGDIRTEKLKGGGWYVCRALIGRESVTYTHAFTAKVVDEVEGHHACLSMTGPEAHRLLDLDAQIERQRDFLKPAAVTAMLVRLVGDLRGTTLRPAGGVYELIETGIDDWRNMAAAVEAAARNNRIYLIRHRLDEDAIRAVRDAIHAEVEGEVKAIQEEIKDEEMALGDRALKARERRAEALEGKVRFYESVLGELMPSLREGCEKARAAAAEAALLQTIAV